MRHARGLGAMDVDSFLEAAESRPAPKSARAARADFIDRLRRDYPMRMRRINRDLRWMRKMAEKESKRTGLGVDDVKWWFGGQ